MDLPPIQYQTEIGVTKAILAIQHFPVNVYQELSARPNFRRNDQPSKMSSDELD